MPQEYDFVVIGAGASGCVLASRLANTANKPSVLLLEAGTSTITEAEKSVTERFNLAFKSDSDLNWRHKTTEQYGRRLDYSAGKGLGGSTAINFCAWIVGSKEDYNEWASMVEDDAFAWPSVKGVLDRIKHTHLDIDPTMDPYVRPDGSPGHGPLGLTYGESKHQNIHDRFIAADQVSWPRNVDLNSGNPIGLGISPACFLNGSRITAADAYLASAPPNLSVMTGRTIARLLPWAQTVIAIDGQIFKAWKEIIVCCGAVKSPQLLMLSGIGDAAELGKHSIDLVHSLPQMGRNLQDHCFSTAGITINKAGDDHLADTVPPGKRVPVMKGWFKLDSLLSSPEFQGLPISTQQYLQKPSVPNWEIAMAAPLHSPENSPQPAETFTAIALIMNPQSRGVVSLRSSNPSDPPLIDPKFLSHPFDRKAIIEALREMLHYFQAPIFKDRTVQHIDWPEADSDEAILKQAKQNLASSWHPAGTVRMGLDADSACVDHDFKVFGLPRLRVADMSVCPFLPCNHTQSTAYLVGEIAAEKIIVEWDLDSKVA